MSSDDIKPRRATAADVSAIRALVQAAYEKYIARIGRAPQPMIADCDAAVRYHQDWLIDGADGLCAILELMPDGEGGLSIENIAVDPGAQKSGLGRQLMAFAEAEALAQGFACVTLYTNEMMVENIALYQRLGYVETARRKIGDFHRVFMRKDLD